MTQGPKPALVLPAHEAWSAVRDFHVRNHQQVGDRNSPTLNVDRKVLLLRARLILEELGETAQALHEDKELEFIDGLCDLSYVVLGTAVTCGVLLPDFFGSHAPLENLQVHGGYLARGSADFRLLTLAVLTQATGRVVGHFVREPQLMAFSADIKELQYQVCKLAAGYGIPFKACFLEVHRANMSKNVSGRPADGEKYSGAVDPKGPGYEPANLKALLYA